MKEDQKTDDSKKMEKFQVTQISNEKILQDSLTENSKNEKFPEQQIKFDEKPGTPRIRCFQYCKTSGDDSFYSDKSKMEIRCCEGSFENTRRIEISNMRKFVCHCKGSQKFVHNNGRQGKEKIIISESRREKYFKKPETFCICSHKQHEKLIHQTLIKKCSYCNLPTNICNCKDPMEMMHFEEESHFLKKYSKSKPYGSEILPYQRLSVFADVMSELQQKISRSVCCHLRKKEPCCRCSRENLGENGKRKEEENSGEKTVIWYLFCTNSPYFSVCLDLEIRIF